MIDCMADLTDEEVLRDFTPPEGGAAEDFAGQNQRIRKEASSRIFAR